MSSKHTVTTPKNLDTMNQQELKQILKDEIKKLRKNATFYKECYEKAEEERDFEHQRFLEEQSKRADLELEIDRLRECKRKLSLEIIRLIEEEMQEEAKKDYEQTEEFVNACKRVQTENEKLKKENEQLKAKLQEVMAEEEDGYATSEWFNEKVDFYIKYQINHEEGEHSHFFHNGEETLFDVVATLEELRDQIKTLQYQNDMEKQCHEREFGDLQSDAEDLRTEVQDLKEELSTVEKDYAEMKGKADTEETDYEDDLEALRSEHEGQLEDMEAEYEEQLQEKDDEHAEEIQEKDEYIKSLEKELEKLRA